MKKVLLTSRIDKVESYQEVRSSVDIRWIELLTSCGLKPLIIPNNFSYAQTVLQDEAYDGLLLSGGNDLGEYPIRDKVESLLLTHAMENRIPVLGVCRGMQLIQDRFGIGLSKIGGHVANRHRIQMLETGRLTDVICDLDTVNSFHNYGTRDKALELVNLAASDDGIIEAVEHRSLPVYGVMWHLEREKIFRESDKNILSFVFTS